MSAFYCFTCGEHVDTYHEGVCVDCWKTKQSQLDQHNVHFDTWERMTDAQRDQSIKEASQI